MKTNMDSLSGPEGVLTCLDVDVRVASLDALQGVSVEVGMEVGSPAPCGESPVQSIC